MGAMYLFMWLTIFFLLMALLAVVVYQLMCLEDLEYDYTNPYDSAATINSVALPEFIIQGSLSLLFLLSGNWLLFSLCVPNLYYNVKQYQRRGHLVDVTDIIRMLRREKKLRRIKLAQFVILLFLSLLWLIWSIVEE